MKTKRSTLGGWSPWSVNRPTSSCNGSSHILALIFSGLFDHSKNRTNIQAKTMLKAECALLGKHRQGDLCALKGILVYMISSRSPRAAQTVLNKKEGGRERESEREEENILPFYLWVYMYLHVYGTRKIKQYTFFYCIHSDINFSLHKKAITIWQPW